MHLGAPFGELCRDNIGGALLLEPDLGMRMDVAADRGQLVEIVAYLGEDRHGGSSVGCRHHSDSELLPPSPPGRPSLERTDLSEKMGRLGFRRDQPIMRSAAHK